MKKTMKRTIAILLIVLTIFNFVYSNYVPVYGATVNQAAGVLVEKVLNLLINLLGGVIGIFTWIPRLIAMAAGLAVNLLTANVAYADGATAGNESFINYLAITPFDIFFNKVQIVDVNFLNIGVGGTTQTIRTAVAKWYYIVRLIAIAILLLILLYVGIRMAISSVASEKAIYKRSLIDWTVSLALVFVLQYIIMFTVNVNSAIVNALQNLTRVSGMSSNILSIALTSLGVGWDSIAATVVYCMIVFQTFVFLVKYMKRMLTVGFLIIISPLISITYSIDKMGDQKAQALNTWLKEFVYNILIQPFHCIMYLAFVDVAFELLVIDSLADVVSQFVDSQIVSAVVAILCLKFIDDGEKIVRKIFGFGQASSLAPLEVAATATALQNNTGKIVGAAQNIRKGINYSKEKGLIGAIRKDFNNRQDNKLISQRTQELQNSGVSAENAARQAAKEVRASRKNKDSIRELKQKNSRNRNTKIETEMSKAMPAGEFEKLKARINNGTATQADMDKYRKAYEAADKKVPQSDHTGKKITGAISKVWNSETGKLIRKNAVPMGVGIALGSMTLGGTNLLAAYNVGKTAYQGTNEFTKSSTKTIAKDAKNYVETRVSDRKELESMVGEVREKGDNGVYDSKSEDTKALISSLEKAIAAVMGIENKKDPRVTQRVNQITGEVSRELLENPETFDLDAILVKALGEEHAHTSEVQSAAGDYTEHKQDEYLYKQIQYATSLGVSMDSFIRRLDREINYSSADASARPSQPSADGNSSGGNSGTPPESGNGSSGGADSTPPESGNSSSGGGIHLESVTPSNIIEHVRRAHNVTEIINKVDADDIQLMEQLDKSLQDRINEIRGMKTEEITADLERERIRLETTQRLLAAKYNAAIENME